MTVDMDKLMQWALLSSPGGRPVRLEIFHTMGGRWDADNERIIARVYLRDPRCKHNDVDFSRKYDCECGALAEKRIG